MDTAILLIGFFLMVVYLLKAELTQLNRNNKEQKKQ